MKIIEIPASRINEYVLIPISFEVTKIFEVIPINSGLGGIQFLEKPVTAYIKDYDLTDSPLNWSKEFSIDNWGIFLAMQDDKPIGAAAVAWNTNGVDMLEGRRDVAVLWDLRVSLERRRSSVGKALFEYASEWSRARNCVWLKSETQNTNVNACRFYAAMGAELGDVNRFAYSQNEQEKNEIQINWYKML